MKRRKKIKHTPKKTPTLKIQALPAVLHKRYWILQGPIHTLSKCLPRRQIHQCMKKRLFMMWDVVRLLSSGKELSTGVACLHRGPICFKGHMQIGERSQDRNDNMTLSIALKNWALIQKPEDQGKDMTTCSSLCSSISNTVTKMTINYSPCPLREG